MAQQLTTAEFDSVLANADKPVLVDFWASWCGPCRALGPVVEEVGNEMADKLDVYKVNVDDEADLATRFRIVSIPTLILFKNGEPVHTMVGNLPKADLVLSLTLTCKFLCVTRLRWLIIELSGGTSIGVPPFCYKEN